MPFLPRAPLAAAARLTWGAIDGTHLDPDAASLVSSGLGGVVLFDRNIGSPDELRALTVALRSCADGPFRIAVDQEGGHIVRVGEPFTRFPGPMALGAAGSEALAFAVARASARELRSVGVDTVLAPVLDLAADARNPTIGARSFGDDPLRVGRLGAATVLGYVAGGVLPVPKHFPGHGRTPVDSHLDFARVHGGLARLRALDTPPFAAAIAAGAPGLMVGHVVYDAFADGLPASLSPAAIRLVREDLRFDGLLVTDALVMDAVAHRMPIPQAAALAIAAGGDVAMALEPAPKVIRELAAWIRDGHLAPARVAQALERARRIGADLEPAPGGVTGLTTRTTLTELTEPTGLTELADLTGLTALTPAELLAHEALAERVARASLTLVADPHALLPLDGSTGVLLVDVASGRASPIEGGASNGRSRLSTALRERLPRLTSISIGADDRAGADAAVDLSGSAEVVVLATRDAFTSPAAALVRRLAATGRPLVHVALRSPADLALAAPTACVPEITLSLAATAIASYADTPITLTALADALVAGEAAFPGQLPMRLEPPNAPFEEAA